MTGRTVREFSPSMQVSSMPILNLLLHDRKLRWEAGLQDKGKRCPPVIVEAPAYVPKPDFSEGIGLDLLPHSLILFGKVLDGTANILPSPPLGLSILPRMGFGEGAIEMKILIEEDLI